MRDTFDDSDILRLLEGDCAPDEAAALQSWIIADPKRVALLDQLQVVWRLTGATTRDWELRAAGKQLRRARFLRAIRSAIPPPWAWIAATVVLVSASAVLWRRPPHAAPFREYATAPGQRSQLTLIDGTLVLLSVDSRLRLPRDYGVHERTVELEGEAYFVVRHDSSRPFVVRTAHGTTEDLGTQFDVRAYREERLQVVVADGRVALRPTARPGAATPLTPLTLHPRERGVVDAGGTVTRTRGIPVGEYVSWTRGVLWFHDAPLRTVIAQLGRWYDLDIAMSDSSLAAETLTISFGPQSADEALTALARVLDVRYTRVGRSVQLISSPIDPPHSRMEDD